MADTELIEGIVSSIVFSNAENGYTVLRLDTAEGIITAAGFIPGITLGQHLRMSGTWSTHPQYGEQFKAESFEIRPPSGVEEVYRYLACGAIKNIGPGRARDIVNKFGAESLNIIENDPDKLAVIKGISLRTARKISEDCRKQSGLRRLISFFGKYGIRPVIATRVYKDYGDDAYEAVQDNPYLIISSSIGAKFADADSIALDLGFESDCPERTSAALMYTLSHNLGNGHTFIPKNKLIAAVNDMIGVGNDTAEDALDVLCQCGDVVVDTISGLDACYLKDLYEAECFVAKRLLLGVTGVGSEVGLQNEDQPHSETVTGVTGVGSGPNSILTFSKLQLKALEYASKYNVLVLTGGPGTGKTTTVRAILEIFDRNGLETCLCAPTGRAAKRMSELCGRSTATIHRLLGAAMDENGNHIFEHDELDPLEADAIIIDECSMIDILLMDALMRALKPSCRIVMVGDADQLPPIGPGNMFSDVIRSGAIPVVALTEIFRQASGSGIVQTAHSVLNGIMPDLTGKYPDMFFMQRKSEDQLAQTISDLYAQRLPKNMGIDPSQIQVLSPTRKNASGTVALNALLRDKLNPRSAEKKEKQVGDFIFRTGDKVMQIKNNYDILTVSQQKNEKSGRLSAGVFNGDVGVIQNIDHEKETVTVDFEDKLVTYTFDKLSELEPAFAITVHKSQGSEYHAVILAMTNAAPPLLTRSVLYTAITRAKALLIIVGSAEVMSRMVQNDKRQKRYSGLKARLTDIK